MEVKPGYKLTEVGVIPEDWEVCRVRDIIMYGPKNGYSGRNKKDSRGTPTLSLSATSTGRLVLEPETVKYLEERLPPDSDLFLMPDDILVQRSNTPDLVGTTAIFTGPSTTFVYPDLMMRMRFRERFTAYWFWRYANSPRGRQFFLRVAAGSTGSMPKISGELLREMPLPIPSLYEQESIAEALSDADALIESLERLIAKKRRIKQGAMQELLTGKRRLFGLTNSTREYNQTEIGKIPMDWKVQKLGNLLIAPPDYGINAPSTPYDMRHPTYIRITDISEDGRFIKESSVSIDHPQSNKYILANGDLVFARTGASVGKSYIYDPSDGVLVFAGFLIRVHPNETRLCPHFLYYYTHSYPYWGWVSANSMRSGQPGINSQQYSSLPIPLPLTTDEQTAIAVVLSDMDAEIAALETKLAKYRQIKQGMMTNLLTGRIRLV
jgi:type I restriction enzyme S subunit